MLHPTKNRRTAAFTLVELLVVIGIIALLISILLPSLNRARQQAATVQCSSNIRQVMQGFVMYANENKGLLPAQRVTGSYEWSRTILATLIGEGHMNGAQPKGTSCDYFRCPSDLAARSVNPSYAGLQPRSYAINSANSAQYFNAKYNYPWPWDFAKTTYSYPPHKLNQIPSRVFLVGEEYDKLTPGAVAQMFVGQSTFYVLEGHFATIHKGSGGLGGNYGFMDGHVEFHVPRDYSDDTGKPFTSVQDSGGDPRSVEMVDQELTVRGGNTTRPGTKRGAT